MSRAQLERQMEMALSGSMAMPSFQQMRVDMAVHKEPLESVEAAYSPSAGDVYARDTNLARVVLALDRLLDRGPRYVEAMRRALVYRARLLAATTRRAEALTMLQRAQALRDASSDVLLEGELGALQATLGAHAAAETHFTRALSHLAPGEPLYVDALVRRAQTRWRLGTEHRASAVQDVEEALFYAPEHIAAHFDRCEYLAETEPLRALEDVQWLLSTATLSRSERAEAHFRLATLYGLLERYGEALAALDQCQRLEVDHAGAALVRPQLERLIAAHRDAAGDEAATRAALKEKAQHAMDRLHDLQRLEHEQQQQQDQQPQQGGEEGQQEAALGEEEMPSVAATLERIERLTTGTAGHAPLSPKDAMARLLADQLTQQRHAAKQAQAKATKSKRKSKGKSKRSEEEAEAEAAAEREQSEGVARLMMEAVSGMVLNNMNALANKKANSSLDTSDVLDEARAQMLWQPGDDPAQQPRGMPDPMQLFAALGGGGLDEKDTTRPRRQRKQKRT